VTLRLDPYDADDLDIAVRLLRDGGLVAFPTETVYGLGASGLDPRSVERIFEAKGRPSDNPLILHVAGLAGAWPLWDVDEVGRRRAERASKLWPGPLTLVLPAAPVVPSSVTAGLPSVAVRVPDHPVARALLSAFDAPIAAPSANLSGRPSPTTADHVFATLDGRIDAVLDGGPCRVGVESTVVDLGGDVPVVLRPGRIGPAALSAALDEPVRAYDPGRTGASPGLRHRHYAPDTRTSALDPAALADAWRSDDVLLLFAPTFAAADARFGARDAPVELLPADPEAAARGLYAALYRLERHRPRPVRVEIPPDDPAWTDVRDRLLRASGVID
jgi:L-threonylcarbamoyladenylate synthase